MPKQIEQIHQISPMKTMASWIQKLPQEYFENGTLKRDKEEK